MRFYEAKGSIASTRGPNNYHDYSEAALGRVQQIREPLNAGLSTQAIRAILPCLQSPRDRHAIADYLAELRSARSEPPRAVISPVFETGV